MWSFVPGRARSGPRSPLRGPLGPRTIKLAVGLAVGSPAPAVAGVTPAGDPVVVEASGPGPPVVLAFLTSGCRECRWWWRALGDRGAPPLVGSVTVVTPGPSTESARAVARIAPDGLRVVMSSEAWEAYGVGLASSFAVLSAGRLAGAGWTSNWAGLTALSAGTS
ncbi:MAG: hypothetical protein ACRDY0_02405 [Acidimicrobiales bacterium]